MNKGISLKEELLRQNEELVSSSNHSLDSVIYRGKMSRTGKKRSPNFIPSQTESG